MGLFAPTVGSVGGLTITQLAGDVYQATTTISSSANHLWIIGFNSQFAGHFTLISTTVSYSSGNWTLTATLYLHGTAAGETFTFYYAYL
jgi:hypothetical protein